MGGPPPRFAPVLEWWYENFALVRDIVTRRHRVHVQSYDGLLRDPERVIHDTVKWLGRGDAEKAVLAVKPENRTQKKVESSSIEPEHAAVFDELYRVVDERQAITGALVAKLNETNKILAPRIGAAQRDLANEMRRRRRVGPGGEPEDDSEGQPSW
jgi:hypothetical protein